MIADPAKISFADQYETVKKTVGNLIDLIKSDYRLVITHGNGPQVGFILIRSHLARNRLPEIPLDVANALTQAEIGYMIQSALKNELSRVNIKREVVTIITQVVVDKNDPSFKNPTKPIGPFYTKREANFLQKELGWVCKEDAGRGFRRFVASPEPLAIVEAQEISSLLQSGVVVIAAGGGGIPVIKDKDQFSGISAVIDKDFASSLLATTIGAELLLISTSVEKVYRNYNRPNVQPIDQMSLAEAHELLRDGQFPAGSMGPKIGAAIRFIDKGGELVIIAYPTKIAAAIKGESGTRIVRKI